nr:phage major capsid protein [Stutzerimonas kunmingensis]
MRGNDRTSSQLQGERQFEPPEVGKSSKAMGRRWDGVAGPFDEEARREVASHRGGSRREAKRYRNPKLTQHMIDDAMFDAESFVVTEISEEFSDQLGAALINGDGVNKPKGILAQTITTEADGVRAFGTLQAVLSASAAGITFDDLKEMKRVLRAKYRSGAAWVMNDTTAMQLAMLKDNNGAYLWAESVSAGEPDTLLGYPVEIDENMPDIAPGAYPVAFGNFKRGYYIARRKGIRLLRDPFTAKPWTGFYTTERVGGDVVNSEAIKLLQVAAA